MNHKISVSFLFALFVMASCSFNENQVQDDPIEIYAVIKEDSALGIDVVSSDGSNPMEVRKRIAQYQIPEETFEQKRATFYAILDKLLSLSKEEVNLSDSLHDGFYAQIDSLNYLAIHYLKNLLKDKKSYYNPLRHKALFSVASADKSFRVYSWNENVGVKFKLHINVYQYFTETKDLASCFIEQDQRTTDYDVVSSKIVGVYKLPSDTVALYLLNFIGEKGVSRSFKGSLIMAVSGDSLDCSYPSFAPNEHCFLQPFAHGESLNCFFDAKKNLLTYRFRDEQGQTDVYSFQFDGRQFLPK